jgi:peptidoglycan hydrolase-like protein with peptidoglycan-binding domain
MKRLMRGAVVAGFAIAITLGTGGIASADYQSAPVLQYGSRGPNVGCVQHALNAFRRYVPSAIPYTLKVDNIYGKYTKADVTSFQQHSISGLKADGIVGPKTRQAMENEIEYLGSHEGRNDSEVLRIFYGQCLYTGGAY